MDKQQATEHILLRLRAGYGQSEIAGELSQILKAPPEVVGRFVAQVVAQNPQIAPPPPPVEDDLPNWMRGMQAEPVEEKRPKPEAPAGQPVAASGNLPPGLQALLQGVGVSSPAGKATPQKPRPTPGDDPPRRAEFVAPVKAQENPSAEGDPLLAVGLQELSEYVLIQLKKQRRYNDIVEAVCQHTGWHWNKAQRFVAQVKTKNHEKLQAERSRVMTLVGIGIMLAGLALAANGASWLADYARLASFAQTNPGVLLDVEPQGFVFALAGTITGVGMIVGGIYGIGRAFVER